MGFFDEILSDFKSINDELQGLKDEFISSVVDPSGELRDTVREFTNDLSGNSSAPVDDAAVKPATSIPVQTDESN
ncbi:MAG: hypothetical protein WAQ27_04535 [Candidatus Microsaccharimonas sp.]